jgi:hypothetical protein
MNSNLEKWFSAVFSAFLGGGGAWVISTLSTGQIPDTATAWKTLAAGFVGVGLVAVRHLLQSPPGAALTAAAATPSRATILPSPPAVPAPPPVAP